MDAINYYRNWSIVLKLPDRELIVYQNPVKADVKIMASKLSRLF